MFDKNWENEIYKNKKQINKYPFDWVVSSTNKYIKKKNKLTGLELGCGVGNNIPFLLDYGFKKIYAIEGSKTACKILKNKYIRKKSVLIINKDFNKYKYKKEYFDLILDRGSITHNKVKDIKSTLMHIKQSLADNGHFFSVMFNRKAHFRTNKKNAQFFKNITPGNKGLLTNFFSKREILYLFRDFKIIELREDIHLVHFPQKKIFSTWNIICKNK